MVVPFAKFTTKKWVVLASKIDQLFIGVGIIIINTNLLIWCLFNVKKITLELNKKF